MNGSYRPEHRFKIDVSGNARASTHRGLDIQPSTDLPNQIFHLREPNALRLSVLEFEACSVVANAQSYS